LTHLLIPLFLYTFLYQCYYAGRFQISFKSVLGGDTIGHLWFVYELLALYLLTPFLQKMLLALNNRGVFSFLALLFFFGRVVPILKNIGLPLGIPTELLGNCSLFFFVLGYALSVQKKTIRLSVLIPLGMVNILYIAYTLQNGILAPGAADLSAGMVIGTLFYFFLFQKCFAWLERTCFIKRAVDFISGRTYGIYLIHMLIFQIFTAREIMMLNPLSLSRYWMLPLKCVIIFLLGLAASIPLDLLICAPLQKGMMWLLCRIGISTKKKERMKP